MKKTHILVLFALLLTLLCLVTVTACGDNGETTLGCDDTTPKAEESTLDSTTDKSGSESTPSATESKAPVTTGAPATTEKPADTQPKPTYNDVTSFHIDLSYATNGYMVIEYNMAGNPLSRRVVEGETMQPREGALNVSYRYDEAGKIASMTLRRNGEETVCDLNTQDGGYSYTCVGYFEEGNPTVIYLVFDENGKMTDESVYEGETCKQTLVYGEGGSVVKEIKPLNATMQMESIYTHRDGETRMQVTMSGNTLMDCVFTYDESGLLLRAEQTSSGMTSIITHQYNEKGLCIASTSIATNGAKTEYTFSYDDSGRLIKEICKKYDAEGNLSDTVEKDYEAE